MLVGRTPQGLAANILECKVLPGVSFGQWLQGWQQEMQPRGFPRVAEATKEYYLKQCDELFSQAIEALDGGDRFAVTQHGTERTNYDAMLAALKDVSPRPPLFASLREAMECAHRAEDTKTAGAELFQMLTELKEGAPPKADHNRILSDVHKISGALGNHPNDGERQAIGQDGVIDQNTATAIGRAVRRLKGMVESSISEETPPAKRGLDR